MLRHARVIAAAILLTITSTPAPSRPAEMDGVMMHRGKMMTMKAGKPVGPMTANLTMSDGSQVMTDGTVKKDGKTLRLKDGQMIMMDGKIMEGGKAARMANPMPSGDQ